MSNNVAAGLSAEGGTRTPTGCPIRPSNVRVYQFHHFGFSENHHCFGVALAAGDAAGEAAGLLAGLAAGLAAAPATLALGDGAVGEGAVVAG